MSVGEGFSSSFFLTRDAATPRAVGRSAALTGDRLRAETEAAPVQRGRAREAARGTSARFAPQGAECLLPPLSSAWLCAAGVGGGVKQNIKKSLPHTHTQPVPRLSPLSYLIMNIISPRKELASPLPVHTTHTLHPYTSGRVRTRHDRRGLDRYSHVLSTHGPASPEKREGHAQPGDSLDYLHPRAGTAGHLSDGRSQHRVPLQ